jgi:chromosome segregation ATPase
MSEQQKDRQPAQPEAGGVDVSDLETENPFDLAFRMFRQRIENASRMIKERDERIHALEAQLSDSTGPLTSERDALAAKVAALEAKAKTDAEAFDARVRDLAQTSARVAEERDQISLRLHESELSCAQAEHARIRAQKADDERRRFIEAELAPVLVERGLMPEQLTEWQATVRAAKELLKPEHFGPERRLKKELDAVYAMLSNEQRKNAELESRVDKLAIRVANKDVRGPS